MRIHQLQEGELAPQRGPQELFLASPATITIYGGAAGGGKSWSLLYSLARWVGLPGFRGLVFRKYLVDIKQVGGLWSEAEGLYSLLGGVPNRHDWEWRFPSGAVIKFGAIDKDYQTRYQGAQAAVIAFDEITHFEEEEVFFFFSRRRTKVRGLRTRILGTCNPDADSWVARLLGWWWDSASGYAIPSRAGVVRWFMRTSAAGGKKELRWAGAPAELEAQRRADEDSEPLSLAFIPASLADNRYLAEDGAYRAGLTLLDDVQKGRLLRGNWLVRYQRGTIFRRDWFKRIQEAPPGVQWWRVWDLAATSEEQANGSTSFTCGLKIGECEGRVYIGGLEHGRWDDGDVELLVKRVAQEDGPDVRIWICRERAGAGKSQLGHYVRLLRGYQVDGAPESGLKELRLGPAAAQAKHGNVYVLERDWTGKFLDLAEDLPARPALDLGDCLSAGMEKLEGTEISPASIAQEYSDNADDLERMDEAWDFSGLRKLDSL